MCTSSQWAITCTRVNTRIMVTRFITITTSGTKVEDLHDSNSKTISGEDNGIIMGSTITVIPLLSFAQSSGQSVASHYQPREYDEASPIFFPKNVDCQVEIGPELLGVLPKFRGHMQDNPYNHLHEF